MSQYELKVEKRAQTGKEISKVLRRQGKLPAVVYGHGEAPVSLTINAREFGDLVGHHGVHSLINLTSEGYAETAIIKSVQRHPYRGQYTTVDFQRTSATETVTVTLPLIGHGEPYAARSGEGVLVQSLHEIEVRALSGEIPESIHVDLSHLELNGPALHVRDLVLPAGVEVLTPGDEAVAALNCSHAEAEEAADAASDAAAAPAVEEEAEAEPAAE